MPITKAELFSNLQNGWQQLQQFIHNLTPDQMTQPSDEAGWTIKDHLIHLAVWEDGMNAMLARQPRYTIMGVSKEVWEAEDIDATNAIIQQNYHAVSLPEALKHLEEVHERLLATLTSLSEADLLKPYGYYQADAADDQRPAIDRIIGNTYEHYAEHIPWMKAIADRAETGH
jgi:uncharacterized protein (TIGR03083 family)